LQTGNVDEALTYGLQALAFREEAQFKPYLPLDHALLSSIYLAKADYPQAQIHAEKAVELADEIGSRGGRVLVLLGLGDIQLAQHEQAQARTSYAQALALAQESQSALLIARASSSLEHLDTH